MALLPQFIWTRFVAWFNAKSTCKIASRQGSKQSSKFARDLLLPLLDGVDVAEFVRLAKPKTLLTQLLRANGQEVPVAKYVDPDIVNQ